jgi:hypothetical protein
VLALCLGLLAAPVLLARLATTERGLRVAGVRLPSLCTWRNATGLPCPGCGLSRSWVEAARGDLAASFEQHRLGLALMLYVLAQALRHGVWLVAPRCRSGLERAGRWLDAGVLLLGVALLANWAVTLARL